MDLLFSVVALLVLVAGTATHPWPVQQLNYRSDGQTVPSNPALQSVEPLGDAQQDHDAEEDKHFIEGPDRVPSHPDITRAIYRSNVFVRQDPVAVAPSEENLQLVSRQRRAAEDQEPVDEHDKFLQEDEDDDSEAMSQHFFPSFAPLYPQPPPLGHSRPQVVFHQESAGQGHRPSFLRPQGSGFQGLGFGSGQFRENSFLQAAPATENNANSALLGSGNFGVIRGGTFYNDDDQGQASEYGSGESHHVYSPYYHSNNGHGRPAFYNPRPQQHRANDFFANFRDFADINTPTKSSFSEFYVVYVNKNGSRPDQDGDLVGAKPKNIIEQLRLLDSAPDDDVKPDKKKGRVTSAAKQKLESHRQEEQRKEKSKKSKSNPKEMYEPLLALS